MAARQQQQQTLGALLLALTEHASPLAHAESLEDFKEQGKHVCAACSLGPAQLAGVRAELAAMGGGDWQALADEGVAMPEVAKTLNALMRYGMPAQACTAAAVYSWLLRAPAAPVHVLLDTLTLSGCLQRVKECAFTPPGGTAKGGNKGSKAAAKAAAAAAAAAEDDDDDEGGMEARQPSQRGGAAGAGSSELDVALALCVEVLTNMARMAQQVPLRSSREVLQAALEGCTELLGCSRALKAPSGAKALGLTTTGTIASAAYSLLSALFSPQHGSMPGMAAALLPRLTPLIVGTGSPALGKRTAADLAGDRSAALGFVTSAFRRSPDIQDAVAALARHVCLRAPDKADNRAAAIKAASELVVELPQWEQEQFVGFVFSLSRTNKIGLRTLSVGLANNLLMNLPEPFKHSTFAAAAASASAPPSAAAAQPEGVVTATPAPTRAAAAAAAAGPTPPAGTVVAPWSVVALAALLQRCSDKSAVVRGRALSDLAEVVDCFSALLAQDPASEQHQVAEAFVEGLGAAAGIQLPQASRQPPPRQGGAKRRGRAGRGGEDEEEASGAGDDAEAPSEGEEQAAAAAGGEAEGEAMDEEAGEQTRVQRGLAFVAFMPSAMSADLQPVMGLVHRRCGDAKAAVRRGGLQLLEALLVMRASWQGYPRQLPSTADLSLLEAATSDPLVSVRKAALVALSTLLELFPAEPRLCQAWVASALPLVRDVEASIQDALTDWAVALLFDKAAAAAASARKAGGKKAAAAAASADPGSEDDEMDWQQQQQSEEDAGPAAALAHELRPLLAAVSQVGSAAGACLGKLCAAMAAKKKLKAAAVAHGLEALIAAVPAGSPSALGAWVVLREVAAQDPSAPSWRFLQERWTAVTQRAAGYGVGAGAASEEAGITDEAASLLLVISHTTAGFPRETAEGLATELLQHVLSFQLPPAAAGAHVTALFRLTQAAGGKAPARATSAGAPEAWSKQVYSAAQEHLRRYIDSSSSSAAKDHTACVAVFTVGQVALLRAAKPPSGLTLLLQALTAHRFLPSAMSGLPGSTSTQAPSQTQAPPADWPAMAPTQGASHQQLLDADAATQAAGGATQLAADGGAEGAAHRPVPAAVQGHAWTSLGKVCLVDEGLAKQVVPLFVQELGRSPFPVVRNNIMVALSDMLIQYTALVDAHMPRLAACIRDRHELVRRQALALLANLLMKDYVKWRGPLFHRFLLALVDPSPAVRQLAEYLLRDVVAVKAPLLAYNHFVEAIFVLNGCTAGLHGARLGANLGGGGGGHSGAAHASLEGGAAEEGAEEGEDGSRGGGAPVAAPAQFTLRGKGNRAARDMIYGALLRSMSAEHKFSAAAKLCGEVLAGVADGLLPLVECEEVLRDALALMACKDIKVSASRLAAQEDEELPGGSQGAVAAGGSATAAEAAAKARGKLVSALMKRHLVEQVVPVLVELRRLLAELRHPLLCELMACFAALLKEYKGEVEDILVADKQLAKEILHDIKQAELQKQQQQLQHKAHAAGAAAAADEPEAAAVAGVGTGSSPPPAGVLAGTPVAAEVLATAERQRRQQLQQLREQQQTAAGGGGGDMPPPSPRAPHSAAAAGAAHTPGALLHTPATAGGSGSRLPAKTPATGRSPGTALALRRSAAKAAAAAGGSVGGGGAAAAGVVASPAPVTVAKPARRGRGRPTRGAAAADENQAPGGAGVGRSSRAARLLQADAADGAGGGASGPATITLPSPFRPTPQRQWNIPQHVATGDKQQQQQQQAAVQEQAAAGGGRGGRRGAAAAAAAKTAAALAADLEGEGAEAELQQQAAAAKARSSKGGRADAGRATRAVRPAAAGDDGDDGEDVDAAGAGDDSGVAAKAAAAAAGGRRGTRQRGAAAAAVAAVDEAPAAGRKRRTKG